MKKLLVVPMLALFLISFQANAQSNKTEVIKEVASKNVKTVTLKVTGMTCVACSNHVSEALKKVDGVIEQMVEYSEDKAVVTFNPKVTTIEAIIKAINETPYTASLLDTKG
ncbi:MAG: cation transporter [Flavobacteriaceae bacterium]